jgi:hypothetical protein
MKPRIRELRRKALALALAACTVLLLVPAGALAAPTPATNDTVIDPDAKGQITIHKFILDGSYPTARNDGTIVPDEQVNADHTSGSDGLPDTVPADAEPLADVVFDITKVVPLPAGDTTSTVVFVANGVSYIKDTSSAFSPNPSSVATNAAGEASTGDIPIGIYLVHEHKPPAVARPADDFLVSIPTTIQGGTDDNLTSPLDESQDYLLYDIHVYPKNEDIGISKKVGTGVDTNSSQTGLQEALTDARGADYDEPVNWYINADLPPQIADNGSNFSVYDTFATGLEYVEGSVEITVDNANFTAHSTDPDYSGFYPTSAPTFVEGTDYLVYYYNTPSTGGGYVKVVLTDAGRAKLGHDETDDYYGTSAPGDAIFDISFYKYLTVKLTTKVLPNAPLNTALENGSELKFVNDPSYTGTASNYPDNPPGDSDYPDLPQDPEEGSNPSTDTNPNDPSYPDTPEFPTVDYPDGPPPTERTSDEVNVYTGGFKIVKKDVKKDSSNNDILLSGAKFKLVKVSEATVAKWDTDSSGAIDGSEAPKFDYGDYTADVTAATAANKAVLDSSLSSGFEQRLNSSGSAYEDYEVTTDANGEAEFTGLSYGKQAASTAEQVASASTTYYYLVETDAPSGYSLPDVNTTPIIAVNYTSYSDDPTVAVGDADPTAVYNSKSFLLPFTGGEGSIYFVVGGIVLVGLGLCLMIALRGRRRREPVAAGRHQK